MNRQIYKNIGITLAAIVLFVGAPFIAHAADLSVVFEQTPLFNESQVAPGDMVTRTVTVTNNGSESHTVVTAADNVANTDSFGDVFDLMIDFGGTNEFSGTFSEFFNEDEVVLGVLGAGDAVVLTYKATIDGSVGNQYQLATMTFDLLVGFQDGEEIPDTPPSPNPDSQPTAGGGNGPAGVTQFFISNVRVVSQDAGTGTAVIAWDTNQLASSKVVYGNEVNAPFGLNAIDTFFGYPQGLSEVFNNTTTHQMTLTGLSLGETYRFRVASRPSTSVLPTTSFELAFTFGERNPPVIPPTTDTDVLDGGAVIDGAGGGGFFTAPGDVGGGGALGGAGEGAGPGGDTTTVDTSGIGAAAAAFLGIPSEFFEFFGSVSCWLWILFLLVIVTLIWFGLDWLVDEERWGFRYTREAGRATTFFVGLGLCSLGAWFLGEMCLVIPLALGSLIGLILLIISLARKNS